MDIVLNIIVTVIILINAFVFVRYSKDAIKTIWAKIVCDCIVIVLELIIIVSLTLENKFPIFNVAVILIQIVKLYILTHGLGEFKKIESQSKDNLSNKRIEDVVV